MKKRAIRKINVAALAAEDKDFHVKGPDNELLINPRDGDEQAEFVCDMHNFGDSDNLPSSDRSMISRSRRCHL